MTHHVTCTLYGPLREIVGTKSLEREIDDEATAGGVFDDLVAEYPDLRALLFDEDGTFSDSVSVMKKTAGTSPSRTASIPHSRMAIRSVRRRRQKVAPSGNGTG